MPPTPRPPAPVPSPFVLLDDVRAGTQRLYTDPVAIIVAETPDAVADALAAIGRATADGLHAAGFVAYEAGHAIEPRTGAGHATPVPLVWFGLFTGWGDAMVLPDPVGGWIGPVVPSVSEAHQAACVATALDLIAAGDCYQVNVTFPATCAAAGDPRAVYAGLRARGGGGHSALIWTGTDWLLSTSPELFFAIDGAGAMTARPMKGTAPRCADPVADAEAARALAADPKQRAENLMIVDLLRNDLSRVAAPGSVRVPALFAVEQYPTVHQMTSTITAQLADGIDAAHVLGTLFPCGSVTGAPKIRAMQAIATIEGGARGVYTGAIGRIDAGGRAADFGVAIRTLHWPDGAARATLGLGSGIVADSRSADEWAECRAKGAFVRDPRTIDLIETMRFDPVDGIVALDAHIARARASAAALGFAFNRHDFRNELQAATFRLTAASRVRAVIAADGQIAIETVPLPPAPSVPWRVALAPLPVDAGDFRLRHKTTDRAFYDIARQRSGADEVLFVDRDGLVTEGSLTSVFVPDGATLVTPGHPAALPSILAQHLVANGHARIAPVRAEALPAQFFVGNAVRGLLPATLHRV